MASGGLKLAAVELVIMCVLDRSHALPKEAIHAAELVEPTGAIAIDQGAMTAALLRRGWLVQVIGDDSPQASSNIPIRLKTEHWLKPR